MSDRLAAHLEAAALLRRVAAGGDFATILKRGDADRGALVLLVTSRGQHVGCLERALSADGYRWQQTGPAGGSSDAIIREWTEKRVRFDEDLWLIELDIADPERFIAETVDQG